MFDGVQTNRVSGDLSALFDPDRNLLEMCFRLEQRYFLDITLNRTKREVIRVISFGIRLVL
jgi:hypothetical protein